MATAHPNLRLWTGDVDDAPAEPPSATPQESADRLYHREAFRSPPPRAAEPYTGPWFEQIENQRYARHA